MDKDVALRFMWSIRENIPDYDEYLNYRDAIREAIRSLEKDIPKMVIREQWNPDICPTCGKELSESLGDGYYTHPTFLERCPNVECAQRLKWDVN